MRDLYICRWCAKHADTPEQGKAPCTDWRGMVHDWQHFVMSAEDDDPVAESAGCPNCGERRMEQLVNRDGVVTCATCKTVYDLEPGREEAPDAS
jgi:protein-arginine kinase activator protein McsA